MWPWIDVYMVGGGDGWASSSSDGERSLYDVDERSEGSSESVAVEFSSWLSVWSIACSVQFD